MTGSSRSLPVALVVLAAGGSRRLGQPKQLLRYRGATLLDATLATARAAGADQVVVALGGAADEVAGAGRPGRRGGGARTPTSATAAPPRSGPRSTRVRDDAAGVVLLLGDQPGVTAAAVRAWSRPLLARRAPAATRVGVCAYDDGLGHPLWFDRSMFGDLAACTATRRCGSSSTRATTSSTCRWPGRCRSTSTPGRTTRRCSRWTRERRACPRPRRSAAASTSTATSPTRAWRPRCS